MAGKKQQGGKGHSTPQESVGEVRLNKLLADNGFASRRGSDALIADGKVMIDGNIVTTLGTKVDPGLQRVEVDGVVIKAKLLRRRYYLLNKPAGVVCTNEERETRKRAVDLISDRERGRIFTVGRLDEDTLGLVILTSDGEFANKVMHPRYGIPKTYQAKVEGRIDDESLTSIREGVYLAEGRTTGARVVVQRRGPKLSTVLITIWEGKNREVRRVFARFGFKVLSLRRVRIGPITDRRLAVGHWRPLTRAEVQELMTMAATPPEQRVDSELSGSGRSSSRGVARNAGRGPRSHSSGERRMGGGGGRGRTPGRGRRS